MISPRTFLSAVLSGVLAASSSGQFISGHRQYPQFRNAASLPGSLHGITRHGNAQFSGAMSISTPVGYSFLRGQRYIGIADLSDSTRPTFTSLSGEGVRGSNTTGYLLGGITFPYGRVSLCGMLLSTQGDTAVNLQWQPPQNDSRLGFSVGVQDLTNSGGSAGEGLPTDGDISRSYYVVATYQVTDDLYVTLGKGDRRFQGLFGSVSHSIGRRLKVVAEYDTFAWNAMVAIDLGQIGSLLPPTPLRLTMTLGVIRGKNAFWGMAAKF